MIIHFSRLPERLAQATARLIALNPAQAVQAHRKESFEKALQDAQERITNAADARKNAPA